MPHPHSSFFVAESENENHLREIASLKRAMEKDTGWAEKNEKMQARVLSYQMRMEKEIKDTEGLLADTERPVQLKLMPLSYHAASQTNRNKNCGGIRMNLFIEGPQGSGKSTLLSKFAKQYLYFIC